MRLVLAVLLLAAACRPDPDALDRARSASCSLDILTWQRAPPDGSQVSHRYQVSYDELGRYVVISMDTGDDGTLDRVTEYTWRPDHQLQSSRTDRGAGGTWEIEDLYTYEDELLVRREYTYEGTILQTTWYTWDERGHATGSDEDRDGDGVVDQHYSYATDQRGNIVREERDEGDDGEVDSITARSWSRLDLEAETFSDFDADGAFDRVINRTWDRDLLRAEWERVVGGNLMVLWEYHYDEEDRLQLVYADFYPDGTWDVEYTYAWDCP